MKAKILSVSGKEKKKINLPSCFNENIREDIAHKYNRVVRSIQPYSNFPLAGKLFSAVGKTKHARNKFRGHYGQGVSRVPRKVFWRRGTQFYWEGAGVSGTVGGRRAHPPKVEHFKKKKKMNKKEKRIAIASALSATLSPKYIKKRYKTVEKDFKNLPIIIEDKILQLKSKKFFSVLEKILDNLYKIARKKKGKKAGLLIITGMDEETNIKSVDVKRVNELSISDLWPLGRLVIYTEKAIQDIDKLWGDKK